MPTLSNRTEFAVPVMVFIDGGYLRKWLKDECNIDIKDFSITSYVVDKVKQLAFPPRIFLIVRTYFYDGIVDPDQPEYQEQNEYHVRINREYANFEVRQGKLVKDGTGKFRQKGVDALLAIDMLDKANSNQYDVAILLSGDLDHMEAVKTVKNKGKQVIGIYDPKTTSNTLGSMFDRNHFLEKSEIGKYQKKN